MLQLQRKLYFSEANITAMPKCIRETYKIISDIYKCKHLESCNKV